jgi:hypothetical protein
VQSRDHSVRDDDRDQDVQHDWAMGVCDHLPGDGSELRQLGMWPRADAHVLRRPRRASIHAISTTASASTMVGDLVLILLYLEPSGEETASAAYYAFTPPAGFLVASWEPISSNDANLTTEETNRQYVFWGDATTAGAATYTVSTTPALTSYAATAIVTVHGAATSGNPFADTPSKASYGEGATVTAFPSVSVTPAADNTGFLWFGTAWSLGNYFGNPAGFASLLESETLSISVLEQSTKATETVAPAVGATTLLTASLMTFR